MSARHPSVLIADDEAEFRIKFVERHARSGFVVEEMADVLGLPEALQRRRHLPDLVVMDLYRTKSMGTDRQSRDDEIVGKLIEEVEAATQRLKLEVDRLKEPTAVRMLHEIRQIPRLAQLPVLIYTRQGLALLSDQELKDASQDGAEWMLKGRSASVEEAQMREFLRRGALRRRRLARDVVLTVAGAALGVLLGVLVQTFL